MPEDELNYFNSLVNQYLKDNTSFLLNITDKEKKECEAYFNNKDIKVYDLKPLSVYLILSKLKENEQIEFIKKNINYIKENHKEIFLYEMMHPEALSYYFSLKVIKELKKIDKELFENIISTNAQNLLYGFSSDDYIEFFRDYYTDINKISNGQFLSMIEAHERCCYNGINNIHELIELSIDQEKYNIVFIDFILENYKEKISSFSPVELLHLISYIKSDEQYNEIKNKYYNKIKQAFDEKAEEQIYDYLSELNKKGQERLINDFFDVIMSKVSITKLGYKINSNIFINLYNKNKELFKSLTLKDLIKISSKNLIFNDEIKKMLDTFDITNIEELLADKFFENDWYKPDIKALRYIEKKFRDNIVIDGNLNKIDTTTSIFSEEYIKNLKELKHLLKNKLITRSDEIYKQHLTNFILYLTNRNIVLNIEGNNFKEIEKLFYRIIMGLSMTVLYEVLDIKEIALHNRIGALEYNAIDFSLEQLQKYNVKEHKELSKKYLEDKNYKYHILKLFLMVGYNNAKRILEIDDSITTLEHLVGSVNVKNIKLDESGNPILNNKIMNLLFKDKQFLKIEQMLKNKESDLYRYFPRIFNEWELIKVNNKDKSLNTIIDFLKSDEISVPPEYNRLVGLFKYIGCSNEAVSETFSLHDQMLKRVESTIPTIKGDVGEYSYEILDLQDMNGLVVGNKTNCCFKILGNGYSCLKHACTSKNGRILVIKKCGILLAHSWIWRNGDLLCLDNIEISNSIKNVNFLDVYLKFADDIIKESFENEGINDCIKNVTIGYTNFDKEIIGINNYPYFTVKTYNLKDKVLGNNGKYVESLPQPIESVKYSDSKNIQYLIKGNGNFKLGQSNYLYKEIEMKETNKTLKLSKATI